jgi:hypothetical protein
MEYKKFLALARRYRGNETDYEYKYMELLVAQKADRINWKKPATRYDSWSELLKEEGLCTVSMFQNYEKAQGLLEPLWIKRLGVYASVSIAQLSNETRGTVLNTVKKWYGEHKVAPTYQRVSKYVRDLGRASRKKKTESKLVKMRAYIKVCQALLKKNRISVPEETWT